MRNPRRIAATPSVTFWIVLASGAVCGAAVAATPEQAVEAVPAVEAPEIAEVPAAPEAPAADIEAVPEVPAPEAAVPEAAATERAIRYEETRPAPERRAEEPAGRAAADREPVPAPQPLILRDGPTEAVAPREGPDRQQGFGTLIAMVALLVAAGAVFVHLRSRKPGADGDDSERLEVLSSIRLAGKWPVSLVRVPGRVLVVGATDKGVTLLAELDPEGRAPVEEAPEDMDDDAPLFDLASRLDAEDDEPLTYRRTRRTGAATRGYAEATPGRAAATRPATRGRQEAHEEQKDEAFLDHLLDRLADARPAVIRESAPTDERDALRQRVKTFRRGPTRL